MMSAPTSNNLAKLPAWLVACASLLLLAVIAYLDFVTPAEVSMALFYLLPVALATWFIGRRGGYVMACICALTWLLVEVNSPTYQDIRFAYWNAFTRLAFFCFPCPCSPPGEPWANA